MGVIVEEQELRCSIPPTRLFKAFIFDTNIPKILPVFKSIDFIEGNGGAGSIKLITYHDGEKVKSMKHRLDEVDERNLVYKVSVIEAEDLSQNFESISTVNKFEGGDDP